MNLATGSVVTDRADLLAPVFEASPRFRAKFSVNGDFLRFRIRRRKGLPVYKRCLKFCAAFYDRHTFMFARLNMKVLSVGVCERRRQSFRSEFAEYIKLKT